MRRCEWQSLFPYLLLTGALLAAVILAPVLAPCDPYAQDLSAALMPPSATYLLGTDPYGRDVFSRVLVGAQTTLGATLVLVAAAAAFGSVAGAAAGFCSGWVRTAIMRAADVFLAFPALVFAVALAGVLGGGLFHAALALAAMSWPKYARLACALTRSLCAMPFLAAAQMAGAGRGSVLWYHVLPNIGGPLLVTAALDIGTASMELAGLSFLGLGAMPPTAEWGAMMANGRSLLQTAPWVILAPGAALFLSVAVFNLLGDAMRDALDTRCDQ